MMSKRLYKKVIPDLTKAIELNPRDARLYYDRAIFYGYLGKHRKAISDYTKLIELNPKDDLAYKTRGIAYAEKGQYDKAIFDYDKAIEINQGCAEAYNGKAWILATCRDTVYRDGAKAVELAKRAVELDSAGYILDTLAAAYAEVGKFEDAITTQEKANDLLKKEGMPKNMIYQGIKQLKSFKAHKPWRERRFGKLRCKK
jgi:tetratricopeptide (TPR) repeat protein